MHEVYTCKMNNSLKSNTFENWNPDRFGRGAQYQSTIRAFSADMISGDILDVGCGSRVFYDLQKVNSWTGLDVSEKMLSGIEFVDNIENTKILKGDILDAPIADHSFDTVIAFFLLHHLAHKNRKISEQRVQKAFHEFFRLLRPGGRLIIAENCRGPLEAPYHLMFSTIYSLSLKFLKMQMPYFWKAKHFEGFGNKSGFAKKPVYVHVPIVESVYQPILGISTPALLNSDLIQKMTLFEFRKA